MARVRFGFTAPCLIAILWIVAVSPLAARAADKPVRRGEIHFEPDANEQAAVPKPFRLERATFAFELKPRPSISDDVALSQVTFPSPVKTRAREESSGGSLGPPASGRMYRSKRVQVVHLGVDV